MLAQRAQCDLLLGRPEKAVAELTLINDMRRLLEAAPTRKPMSLVAAMINVAVTGVYVETIADGIHLHAWREPQLIALQTQLAAVNLPADVADALPGGVSICLFRGGADAVVKIKLSYFQPIRLDTAWLAIPESGFHLGARS